jgi:hypothetical protein
MIRQLEDKDVCRVLDIHKRFYEKEFIFPDLCDPKWLGKYVVTDEWDNIILFGGVKLLIESIAVTDKSREIKERRDALIKLLQASLFLGGHLGFDSIHAFIQDPKWAGHLKHHGFRTCRGEVLITDI